MKGFYYRGEVPVPEWAGQLRNFYWIIRNEGRDKAKRRKYYRLISKEKLHLAELDIDQDLIHQVCRYLAKLKPKDGLRMLEVMDRVGIQLSLDFDNKDRG